MRSEIAESIACLRGHGPADLMEVTYALGAEMLMLGGVAKSKSDARRQLERVVANGAALAKFREIVAAQGGDVRVIDDPIRLPQARVKVALPAPRAGWVTDVDAMNVALAALRLGAGRGKADDAIDPAVGISALVKIGERVAAGDSLCQVHANEPASLPEVRALLEQAFVIADTPVAAPQLIAGIL